jgi:predicted nucleic acid-binding protein
MSRILLDTSCLVATVLAWHEHHGVTVEELRRRSRRGETWVVAAHSLVEAYSVLTRLPANRRLAAGEALAVLRANWSETETISLNSQEHWAFLQTASDSRIMGGQAYDALLAACARKAGVHVLLTWNEAHFARWAGPFEVRRPGAGVPGA